MINSRRMRWVGHVALMGTMRSVCRILVGKPERKRPLGRPIFRLNGYWRYRMGWYTLD
jgi:hypothetical protein